MSDTPRTDAEVECVKADCRGEYHLEGGDFVSVEFARRLERELNVLIDRCRKACLEVGADAIEAAKSKDATGYVAGYQDAAIDCDEALRALK